jgi:hypothetical protein
LLVAESVASEPLMVPLSVFPVARASTSPAWPFTAVLTLEPFWVI